MASSSDPLTPPARSPNALLGACWVACWVACWAACWVGGLAGCQDPPPPYDPDMEQQDDELLPQVYEEEEPPSEPPPPVSAPPPTPPHEREPPWQVEPAALPDREYDSDEEIEVRRYAYRVRMRVPGYVGGARPNLAQPMAELFVDVSEDRIRARLEGIGWPVSANSEIRLRRDAPGVYLFDGRGGRALEPGQLAVWFEGGPTTRRGPPLWLIVRRRVLRRGRREEDEVRPPGPLICALLAEWSGEPRSNVMRRCERGAPHIFRFGFWSGEQTADVPLTLPRRALRADEREPPERPPFTRSRALLEPEALTRLPPRTLTAAQLRAQAQAQARSRAQARARARAGAPEEAPAPIPAGTPERGLRVHNRSLTRVIVAVDGVAVGWVDHDAVGHFEELPAGLHEVGAMRPLGAVVERGRDLTLPAMHEICDGRCSRQPRPEPEPEP